MLKKNTLLVYYALLVYLAPESMQWIVITSPHSLIGKLSFVSVKCMSVRMSKLVIKVPTTNLMTCVRELEQLYHKSCRKTFLSRCHILESMPVYYILQGVSEWTDISKSALRGRKINNFTFTSPKFINHVFKWVEYM